MIGACPTATIEFIDVSLAAVYPDELKALSGAKDSLAEIHSSLREIRQFWWSTSRVCQNFVSKGAITIKRRQAVSLARTWREYQEALNEAASSIAKTCDAILVNAVGAPTPRDPATAPVLQMLPPTSDLQVLPPTPRDPLPPRPSIRSLIETLAQDSQSIRCWDTLTVRGLVADGTVLICLVALVLALERWTGRAIAESSMESHLQTVTRGIGRV